MSPSTKRFINDYEKYHKQILSAYQYGYGFPPPPPPPKPKTHDQIEEEKGRVMSTELVKPSEISDVADSTDLLRALEVVNFPKVDDQLAARTRTELRKKREKEIFKQYEDKARGYYDGIFKRCRESAVGHSYVSLDVGHTTIQVCNTCSHPKGTKTENDVYGDPQEKKDSSAIEYKQNLVRNLAKQMIELDKEAGILDWPEDDDFHGLEDTLGKKKGLFRR